VVAIPDNLRQAVGNAAPGAEIRFAEQSDLSPDGQFGEQWVVATPGRVLVFGRDRERLVCTRQVDLRDVDSVESLELAGVGMLELLSGGKRLRLVAYSDARGAAFQKFKWRLSGMLGNDPGDAPEPRKQTICPACSKPLPLGYTRCPRCTPRSRTLARLLKLAWPHRRLLVLVLLLTALGTLCGLVTPYLSKIFIDFVFKPDPATGTFPLRHWHLPAVGLLLLAFAAQNLFAGLQERTAGLVGFRTVYDLRAALYERIQSLSLSFFDRHHTGAIMARVNQDTAELQRLMVDFAPMSLDCLLMIVGVGVGLFVLSWRLTVFVVIPIGVVILFLRIVIPRVRSMFNRYYRYRAMLSAFVNDSLSGVRVVKSFGQESVELNKFDAKSSSYRDSGIDLLRRWSVIHPAMHFLIMCGTVTVWLVGGRLIFRGDTAPGHMTLGDVVAYAGYLMMFYRPVFMLTRMSQLITTSLSAAHRVFDVVDTEPEIRDDPDAQPMPDMQGAVEFRNVVFGYEKHRPVLKGLNLKVMPHEKIGLVGKSGAGKSTLINVLCRLYDVDQGRILIDGVDIRKVRYADLRRHVAVVLQDSFLFSGTLLDNIRYARPDATREEVIAAAVTAHAHDFIIEKTDGYDTEVGERGDTLSGGEKQRIAIARAILRNPRILILDEPTSSVDVETEKQIQKAVSELTKNRTTFAIAHRLSTLRDCDRLLVIEDGQVVEEGTHEELLAKKGTFHRLASMQGELQQIVAVGG
jgi:ATP-binding cassette subfamily B protein